MKWYVNGEDWWTDKLREAYFTRTVPGDCRKEPEYDGHDCGECQGCMDRVQDWMASDYHDQQQVYA